jgi:YHS domain-containing protein
MGKVETAGGDGLVACEVCLREIPKSVAECEEGRDYVYYFCGAKCYEKWQALPGIREITLTVTGLDLDFETAERLARTAAYECAKEAMLIAWFDRQRGKEHPEIPECQHKPGWLAYAESHDGKIRIDINQGMYIFMFSPGI